MSIRKLLKESGMDDKLTEAFVKADEIVGDDIFIPLSIKNMSNEDFFSNVKIWLIFIQEYIKSGQYELPCYLLKRLSNIFEAKKSEMSKFDIFRERERNYIIDKGYLQSLINEMRHNWYEDIIIQKEVKK